MFVKLTKITNHFSIISVSKDGMKSNLALIWYASVVCTLTFSLLMLILLSTPKNVYLNPKYQSYKALPDFNSEANFQKVTLSKEDARSIIINNFFASYKSPLANYADSFIKTADKYGLDYRLLPAISMQESNGAKILPHNSYNPFGYGIYGGKILKFNSFEEAIETVGKGIKENYIERGLTTPAQIMAKYTPPSLAKGGPWAIGVSTFMEELR